jgi:SAM-dependent methyltransferase
VEQTSADYYQFEDLDHPVIALLRRAQQDGATGRTMLDLGCGRARLGLEIERLGLTVTGIDNSAVACETARRRISKVIELDMTDFEGAGRALTGRRFDWLLAADVLEHAADPRGVLSFYRQFLEPGGHLIVALPNILVWDNRLRLLLGRFDYTDSGAMDRRHLRFFTFRSARQLLLDAGFTPIARTWQEGIVRAFLPLFKRMVPRGNDDPGVLLDSPAYRWYQHYVMPAEHALAGLAPGLLAFRVVQLARPTNAEGPFLRDSLSPKETP